MDLIDTLFLVVLYTNGKRNKKTYVYYAYKDEECFIGYL